MIENSVLLTLSAAKSDFMTFAKLAFQTVYPSEHLHEAEFMHAISYVLKRVDKGREKRLIFNLPPRNLKTFLITICYSAWSLGHNPSKRIIIASYGDDLSQKFLRDIRQILGSSWYKHTFPQTVISQRKNSGSELETTKKGFIFATSTGSTLTGRGANLIIVDDPMKAADVFSEAHRKRVIDWFHNTLYTRLDSKKNSVLMVVMQRLHEDDLTGHLEQYDAFRKVSFPAIATSRTKYKISKDLYYRRKKGSLLNPDHEVLEGLKETRQILGNHGFSAQYQQDPIPFDGTIFKRDYFRYFDEIPNHIEDQRTIISWDTANTAGDNSDYTVGTVWSLSQHGFFLLEVIRVKQEYSDVLLTIQKYRDKYERSELLIEPAGSGIAIIQRCKKKRIKVWHSNPTEDKITRALRQMAYFERGLVLFKKDAVWLPALEKELLGFPNGKNDDQVDSITQALLFAERFFNPVSLAGQRLI
jgi:predicted phage terminase large subunit-like protein